MIGRVAGSIVAGSDLPVADGVPVDVGEGDDTVPMARSHNRVYVVGRDVLVRRGHNEYELDEYRFTYFLIVEIGEDSFSAEYDDGDLDRLAVAAAADRVAVALGVEVSDYGGAVLRESPGRSGRARGSG